MKFQQRQLPATGHQIERQPQKEGKRDEFSHVTGGTLNNAMRDGLSTSFSGAINYHQCIPKDDESKYFLSSISGERDMLII
jgi:hypothetical protein